MDKMKKPYLSSALWPGIVLGLLSAIPYVNAVNCLCCLWVLAGGALASVVLKQEIGECTIRDGAIVGLEAGIIGAIISTLGSLVQWFFFRENFLTSFKEMSEIFEMEPEVLEMGSVMLSNPWFLLLSALFSYLIIDVIFGVLGGIIGASIWGKGKKKDSQSSLPEDFSGDEN